MSGKGLGGLLAVAVMVAGGFYVLGDPRQQADADYSNSSSGRGCPAEVDGWHPAQVRHATTITRVARDMDMPREAVVVALATAMQESGLRNLPYGAPGEDSFGLFQQRPSQGWGTRAEVMDPEHAARSFFRSLRKVDGWEDMRVTEAAQRVQRSAYPEAYQKHVPAAKELAQALRPCR